MFDDTLKTALSVSLRQSPFLNLLPDSQVTATLELMTLPPGSKLTPEVARELCMRANSKAYLTGTISNLGSEYVLGLKAVNCQNGDTLAQTQVTAAAKEKVLDGLGNAASKLRQELGESLATVQKYDVSLEQATTPSLEALRTLSLGVKLAGEKGLAAALPFDQRAIQIDPNFAMAYMHMGATYFSLGQVGRASDYFAKAFELREHASERERLEISCYYYRVVTGDLDKAAQITQEEIAGYPRVAFGYGNLGLVLAFLGQYTKAAEMTREAKRLAPETGAWRGNLVNDELALQQFDQVRQTLHEMEAQGFDDLLNRDARYALAFLESDAAAMAEQQLWFAAHPEYENYGLTLASDTEAYVGHLRHAREFTERAVAFAVRSDSQETGAIWLAIAAQREAAYGTSIEARRTQPPRLFG